MGKVFYVMKKRGIIISTFVLMILLIDQVSKVWIKTTMTLGESIRVFDWFYILFIENDGMAFGMTLGSKLFLTVFRLLLIVAIVYYVIKLVRRKYKLSFLLCLSLILAGAMGNLIDCLFYGVIFFESTFFDVANLSLTDGYAALFYGKVVDMLYFPLFTIPTWVPFVGGDIFFSPVFNFADSAITVGFVWLFLFHREDFSITLDDVFKKKKIEDASKN